ncbi:hypothetical protein A1Q2_06439 [Trichosporon asahii var. asahii CBS 8904]|uniref:Uncharacterized protein n=1 Tax=Trichosporon asahii var. asahii (strain CBS 8904) TaxID=1220162 RepID=K1V5J7_TRIAC|nr:hypothetical protein A1Q2_06439 [Trichosporon asahii var. asahii CBS 8904]
MPALADTRHYSYRDHERDRERGRDRDRDRDREHFRRTSPPLAIVPGSPGRRPIQSSSGALLSLSQDITALVSLSFEATFSLVNDYVRAALGTVGVGQYVRVDPSRSSTDTGSGLAVVVVGAADPSSPLSTLLLAWSGIQKRIQARDPGHTGAVVPVIIDSSGDAFLSSHVQYYTSPPSPPKGSNTAGRFTHAGDTVRAYCHENNLALVAIVCAAPVSSRAAPKSPNSPQAMTPPSRNEVPIPGVPSGSLTQTDEESLLALYNAHILDPLNVVRALGDMLVSPRGSGRPHGRVLFVEAAGTVEDADLRSVFGAPDGGAGRMIAAARTEAASLLRKELSYAGIDVCEVVVGPMCPSTGLAVRSASMDSDTDKPFVLEEKRDAHAPSALAASKDDVLASRLRLLARVFAVDDALVYSLATAKAEALHSFAQTRYEILQIPHTPSPCLQQQSDERAAHDLLRDLGVSGRGAEGQSRCTRGGAK